MLRIDIRNLIRAISGLDHDGDAHDHSPTLYLRVFYIQNGTTLLDYDKRSTFPSLFDQEFLLKDLNRTFRIGPDICEPNYPVFNITKNTIQAKKCTNVQWVNHVHKLLVNLNPTIHYYGGRSSKCIIDIDGSTCNTEFYPEND